jgi:hypothetical protein
VKVRRCAGCEARQQTIVILCDQIDYMRSKEGLTAQSASAAIDTRPRYVERERKHTLEDEEDIMAMLENGAIDTARADELLAQMQAFNTVVEVQKP